MTFPAADLRLIAVDMDGTLLDGDGRVPAALWPLLDRLRARGIHFAPASGRQLATLQREFEAYGDELVFIAENGAHVVSAGVEVSSDALDLSFVHTLVERLRGGAASGRDIGVVLCGKRSAYIERADAAFRDEAANYYARLEVVEDLTAVDDVIVKIAVFDFVEAAEFAATIDDVRATHQVVVSGHHWTDVMNQGVNKGVALRRLQERLGVTAAQTAVFGDYLNDLEMLDAADLSFAMTNAHPDVAARARHRAPSNLEYGVITTIERLLGEE